MADALAAPVEPTEVMLALVDRPAGFEVPESDDVKYLLLLRRRAVEQRQSFRGHAWRFEINQQLAQLAVERKTLRRVKRIERIDDAFDPVLVGATQPNQRHLDDAQRLEFLGLIQLVGREPRQRIEQVLLDIGNAAARERQQDGKRSLGARFRQRPTLPLLNRLALEGNARGVTDPAIVAVQMRPGKIDSTRIRLAVEGFEFVAQVSLVDTRQLSRDSPLRTSRLVPARIRNPIEPRLRAPSARRKIHRAIRAKLEVGDVQRRLRPVARQPFWRNKIFNRPGGCEFSPVRGKGSTGKRPFVGGTARRQVDGENTTVRPVHDKQRCPVPRREPAVRAELDTGRRSDADIQRRGQAVGVPIGPLGASFAKAVVAAADNVVDADGPIPGHAPIPFHVAVEAEQFALAVEGDVIGVAETGGEKFTVPAIGIHARHESARRLLSRAEPVAVLEARQQHVVRVVSMG